MNPDISTLQQLAILSMYLLKHIYSQGPRLMNSDILVNLLVIPSGLKICSNVFYLKPRIVKR